MDVSAIMTDKAVFPASCVQTRVAHMSSKKGQKAILFLTNARRLHKITILMIRSAVGFGLLAMMNCLQHLTRNALTVRSK